MKRKNTLAAAALAAAALASGADAQQQQPAPVRMEVAFKVALNSIATGQPEQAVRILRKMLATDPDLIRVRLELARALYEAGEYTQAQEQFRIVLSSGELPAAVRANVLRFLRAIDEERGLRTSFSIGLEAPQGAGRSYETDDIDIDFGAGPLKFKMEREDPPLTGLALSGAFRKQWPLKEFESGVNLTGYVRGSADLYETSGTFFDKEAAELGTGLQWTWPRTTSFVEATAGTTYRDKEMSEEYIGIGTGVSWRTQAGLTTALEVDFQDVSFDRYPDDGAQRTNASVTVVKPLRGRDQVAVKLSYQRQNADRADIAYDYAELRVGRRTEIGSGFLLEPSVFAEGFWQEEATAGLAETRTEHEFGVDLRVDKTDTFIFGRFTPYVEVGFSKRTSSIDAYSYRDTHISAGLTSAF